MMKRISFFESTAKRNDHTLHIETEDCVVNIRTKLYDRIGRKMTSVEILPDSGKLYRQGKYNHLIITKKGK